MNRKMKYVLLTVSSLLAAFVLAACGSGESDGAAVNEADASGEPVEVTFWHSMNAHNLELLSELVEEFNNSQDRIVVTEQNQGDNNTLSQNIMAGARANELPTMAQMISANQPEYIENGFLAPLDELLVEENGFSDELKNSVYDGFIPEVTYDDTIYAIPFNKSVRVLYVNETILDEIGASIPETWADVEEVGVMLQEQGYDIPALGVENSLPVETESQARGNGADWISLDLTNVDMSSDKAIEPIEWLQNMVNNGYARTAGEDGFMSGPFGEGHSAFYYGSSAGIEYFIPSAEEKGYKISAIEAPNFGNEDEKSAILFGNNLGVFDSASDAEKAAAVEFMSFLLQPENTARWAVNSGYLPITEDGIQTDLFQEHINENPIINASLNTLEYAVSSPSFDGQNDVYLELETAMEDILINNADVKSVMEEIEQLAVDSLDLQ